MIRVSVVLIVACAVLTACSGSPDVPTSNCPAPEDELYECESLEAPYECESLEAPYECLSLAVSDTPHVLIVTNMGTMIVELWPDIAYKHCQSFMYLVRSGFYDSLTFHRVVQNFVIQGGDPNGDGTGGPGYTVPLEASDRLYIEGTLGMARSADTNSAGSQFFLSLGRLASLDGKYTVFGHLVDGFDVLHAIENVPATQERPATPVYMERVCLQ